MTSTTILRDRSGRQLGTIDVSSVTGIQLARYTRSGRVVGSYNPRLDQTHRVTGQIYGSGNLLSSPLADAQGG
jgi:hypothetical protein